GDSANGGRLLTRAVEAQRMRLYAHVGAARVDGRARPFCGLAVKWCEAAAREQNGLARRSTRNVRRFAHRNRPRWEPPTICCVAAASHYFTANPQTVGAS